MYKLNISLTKSWEERYKCFMEVKKWGSSGTPLLPWLALPMGPLLEKWGSKRKWSEDSRGLGVVMETCPGRTSISSPSSEEGQGGGSWTHSHWFISCIPTVTICNGVCVKTKPKPKQINKALEEGLWRNPSHWGPQQRKMWPLSGSSYLLFILLHTSAHPLILPNALMFHKSKFLGKLLPN